MNERGIVNKLDDFNMKKKDRILTLIKLVLGTIIVNAVTNGMEYVICQIFSEYLSIAIHQDIKSLIGIIVDSINNIAFMIALITTVCCFAALFLMKTSPNICKEIIKPGASFYSFLKFSVPVPIKNALSDFMTYKYTDKQYVIYTFILGVSLLIDFIFTIF